MDQLDWPVPEFDDAELDELLGWLEEPELSDAGAAAQDKPLLLPTPAPAMVVNLGCCTTAPSPFSVPELQSAAPRTATPAPSPRRSRTRSALEPFRSASFRSLAPKRSLFAGPEQAQPQPQPHLQPVQQRSASCAVLPRVLPLAAPRAFSAGAASMPFVSAPKPVHTPNTALAWAAGFSRLATQLGCASPTACGGLWDPPESSDLLTLLTLELGSCSRTSSPRASASGSRSSGSGPFSGQVGSSAPSAGGSPSHSRKRKAEEELARSGSQDSHASCHLRQRTCPPNSPVLIDGLV